MDNLRFFRHVSFSSGELSRVRQILRPSGTTMILPYDQFIEHDCRHLEAESDAGNPDYIINLAIKGGYNAVAIHYGLAKRFWSKYDGQIPLILKINGKTSIPGDSKALSVYTSYVEDAVRIGAVAVGYTMYYGSPRQDEDLPQLATVRKVCEKYGMPLIVWAYPRGEAIEVKGGKDSNYALESAARLAMEMGATIIKSNLPKPAKPDYLENEKIPEYFRKLEKELQTLPAVEQKTERARRVVAAAQGVPVLFSGGDLIDGSALDDNSEAAIQAGCLGFIYGRNMWKREESQALTMTKSLQELLDKKGKPMF
jgi:class I fructose-bisphosphate aldolase